MAEPQLVYDIEDRRYINIGRHCTLQCRFCPKTQGSLQVHEYDLTLPRQPGAAAIIDALGDLHGIREVVFCGYSEPTLRVPVLLEVARAVKSRGVPVRVNTDGLGNLANQRDILPELATCVDSLSISMNAQNEALYNRHCDPQLPGSYQAMLDFATEAPRYIPDVTVTAIQGLEGVDIAACEAQAKAMGVKFRTRYLDQVG